MEFLVEDAFKFLNRTPATVTSLLNDLPEKFIS